MLQQTQFQNQKLLMHRQCTAIPSEMRYNIVFFIFQKENKEMSEKRCYTVQELQEILGVSRPTIYNLLKKKEFRWIQLDGGKYRISKKSFDDWLDNLEQ